MSSAQQFQEQIVSLVRAFGWHRPLQTPCGQPVAIAEAHALLALSQTSGLTQNQLAQTLNLSRSTVSRLVSKLVERGWIEKRPSENDGRAVNLSLTAIGTKKAAELAEARQKKLSSIWDNLSPDQQQRLTAALQDLMEAIHVQK